MFFFPPVSYGGWNKSTVGRGLGHWPYGLDIGAGRNDGISRVYLGDYFLYELVILVHNGV